MDQNRLFRPKSGSESGHFDLKSRFDHGPFWSGTPSDSTTAAPESLNFNQFHLHYTIVFE